MVDQHAENMGGGTAFTSGHRSHQDERRQVSVPGELVEIVRCQSGSLGRRMHSCVAVKFTVDMDDRADVQVARQTTCQFSAVGTSAST